MIRAFDKRRRRTSDVRPVASDRRLVGGHALLFCERASTFGDTPEPWTDWRDRLAGVIGRWLP